MGKAKVHDESINNPDRGANPNPRFGNVGGGYKKGVEERDTYGDQRERETSETRCEEIRTMAGWGQEDHLIASTVTEMVTSRHHVPIPHSATIAKKMDIGSWHAQPRKDSI
jgi:hypothetical protein